MKKSEILFLYETSYNIPNGDPFTGEQRYDEETRKILVSDVRIKRFVRSYLEDVMKLPIYVSSKTGAGKTDSKGVITWIAENRNPNQLEDIKDLLKEQIDVRLFGGISTLGDKAVINVSNKKVKVNGHVQLTGPVQFASLSPSLNKVDLRMHQNTSHFKSKDENTQGSIGTTTLVPYSVVQVHGWVNPLVGEDTGLTDSDLLLLYQALWYGTSGEGSSLSRSKVGQDSLLLLVIEYEKQTDKIYGIDRKISIIPQNGKHDEQLRSFDDFNFDFSKLLELSENKRISKIKFYTEIDSIKDVLKGDKFEEISL